MINKIPDIKQIVAKNLIKYRKEANLTQSQVAEQIHYSDKAISKWERGEALPDIYVLKHIADVYKVELDDLLHQETGMEKLQSFTRNRTVIAILSVLLVWLIAMVSYVIMEIIAPNSLKSYLSFVVAVPVSFIVALVFNNLWGSRIYNIITVSGITWGVAISLVCSLIDLAPNVWYIYFIAAIFEVMVLVWYLLDFGKNKDGKNRHKPQQNIQVEEVEEETSKAPLEEEKVSEDNHE